MTIPDATGAADAAVGDPAAALRADVEAIVALERMIRAAQAEQLRLIRRAHGYAHAVEGVHDGSPAGEREFATRAFIAEVATALVIPEATASGLVADAGVAGRHPATLTALATGSIGLPQARSIFDAVIGLPAAAAAALEEAALERAPSQTNAALRRRLRTLRERLHPELLGTGHRVAVAERRVVIEPAPDGMAWLSLYLQAERAHAIKHRLDASAAASDNPEAPSADPRTHGQSVLDAAADLLLAGSRTGPDGRPVDGDAAILPRVLVTVPVLTLLGHTDEPAELDGYGPIDTDTACWLAGKARSWQRILTHPETGAYLSYGRTRYRVPADLAGYLRVRDGTCRFPGCNRRAEGCDFDHTTDWAHGGGTCAANIAVLCRKHHRLKHRTRWRITLEPGGVIRWTSPAGRDHTTQPENPFLERPDASAQSEDAPADEHDDAA
ncbi:HNH endonuclease signature motif containing protein [Agromyces sp. H66]|uniref:HNH endonuclease signature motif containing protein n=1 Tax=Agromyces sp. H66 TaxID=2529859 RepID=UPI0010A997BA|nr:HNH endonuclease signature motif containing protein [Agromyces sp. H66]